MKIDISGQVPMSAARNNSAYWSTVSTVRWKVKTGAEVFGGQNLGRVQLCWKEQVVAY